MVSQSPPITSSLRTTPIKHLFEVEMWARREKGLCYNCDKKFIHGHLCVEQKLYLLDVDSPLEPKKKIYAQDPVDAEGDIQQLPLDLPTQEISLHALAVVTTP